MIRVPLALIVVHALALGSLSAAAQTPAPPPSGSPADAVEFQTILIDFLKKRPGKPAEAEWESAKQAYADLVKRLDDYGRRAGMSADVEMMRAICLARRASILLEERRKQDRQVLALGDQAPAEMKAARAAIAREVADEYAAVEAALSAALRAADGQGDPRGLPSDQILAKGVILAQTALAQLQAGDAQMEIDPTREVERPSEQIRALLQEAQGLLREYVERKLRAGKGLEYVRGRFYLAVVNYRLALDLPSKAKARDGTRFAQPGAAPGSETALEDAIAIFRDMSDPQRVFADLFPTGDPAVEASVEDVWEQSSFRQRDVHKFTREDGARFYAASSNLYLGLIEAIQANAMSGAEKTAAQQRAKEFLHTAQELDVPLTQPEPPPALDGAAMTSLTNGVIPPAAQQVIDKIDQPGVGEAEPLNDLRITWGIGALYDSNVTLLGRNTEAPLDKRRKRDFRVPTLMSFDYTLDLNALDKGNEFLRRWQVFFEARVAPTWNARIHDYNEQFYGATANLRYEIYRDRSDLGTNEDGRPIQGAAWFIDWRYDYDYYLLGNDGFLKQNRIRPSLRYISENEFVDASLFFAYEDRNYLERLRDERFDRDGNYFSWGADAVFDLSKIWPVLEAQRLYNRDGQDLAWGGAAPIREDYQDFYRPVRLRLGVGFTSNSTVGDEFDYDSQIVSGGVTVPLPLGMDLSYDGIFEWQNYWQHSLVDRHRAVRSDFIQEHQFRLSRRFYSQNYDVNTYLSQPLDLKRLVVTLYGDIRFTIDDSNVRDRLGQSVYEYNRVIYGAGLRFDLN